jgi:hypothetical protein
MKECATQIHNQPWSVVRDWNLNVGRRTIPHEVGHSLYLYHRNSCPSSLMSQTLGGKYFSPKQIGKMYRSLSTTSVRQYATDNSYKNSEINITSNENLDVDMKIYSDIVVENNSVLTTSCNLITSPLSKIVVKNGGEMIMDGSDINAVNNSIWDGVKIEGSGSLKILPGTEITGNFSALTGYSYQAKGNNSKKNIIPIDTIDIDKATKKEGIQIYPNPARDFITVKAGNTPISRVSIYNMNGAIVIIKNNGFENIDLSNLGKGIYFIKVESNEDLVIQKIILK